MFFKKIKKDKMIRKKSEFNLIEVIIVMIVTSICSITLTIIVSYTLHNTSKKIKNESDLVEVINTYDTITNEYYGNVNKSDLIEAAIEGMIDCLEDPYSIFISSEESSSFSEELSGEYVGIGARIIATKDKTFKIYEVFDNSPAYKSGLKKDDQIIKVNGEDVSSKNSNQLISIIKGQKNTDVKITVKRDGKELDFDVKRSNVDIPSVNYKFVNKNDKNIAVVSISTFAANTYKQFSDVIDKINQKNVSGLIIDLRSNTGGYLAASQSILEMFVDKGDIMYQLNTKGKITKVVNKKEPTIKYNTVILVNKSTASASEIFAASLKENLKSEVIGVTTYGKGKVQKFKKLSNGSIIKYTTQSWLTPSGKEIDGNGIEPTVEVKLDKKYVENPIDENDNQLQKALNIIVD